MFAPLVKDRKHSAVPSDSVALSSPNMDPLMPTGSVLEFELLGPSCRAVNKGQLIVEETAESDPE